MSQQRLIKPLMLKPGAHIGLVTPSEPVNLEWFNEGVTFLRDSGFKVSLGEHVLENNGHVAGTDVQRARDIHSMFSNPDIDAVFCSAGGANSNRLLDLLDYELIARNPKVFMGLSDPTCLLNTIHAKTGLVTFHGPVVQFDMRWHYTSFTEKHLQKALFTPEPIGVIEDLSAANVLRPGKAYGCLIGGNLSSLQTLLGTPYEPEWEEKLLFWEEIFEQPQTIDAKLTHFRQAGVFERISGMVIGALVECEPHDYPGTPPVQDIVLDICSQYDFPIIWAVNLGHTQDKLTIPLGVAGEIDTSIAIFSIVESGTRQ